jgi:hypothetical protein
MARKRGKMVNFSCPACDGWHETPKRWMLVKRPELWLGYVANMWCYTRQMQIVKLYDENYKYVSWQQNLWASVPDNDDIPF